MIISVCLSSVFGTQQLKNVSKYLIAKCSNMLGFFFAGRIALCWLLEFFFTEQLPTATENKVGDSSESKPKNDY